VVVPPPLFVPPAVLEPAVDVGPPELADELLLLDAPTVLDPPFPLVVPEVLPELPLEAKLPALVPDAADPLETEAGAPQAKWPAPSSGRHCKPSGQAEPPGVQVIAPGSAAGSWQAVKAASQTRIQSRRSTFTKPTRPRSDRQHRALLRRSTPSSRKARWWQRVGRPKHCQAPHSRSS
jgi:hypothetical protein